ncbi:hypothetical protein BAE44_0016602 [Dichanthelium oligosanthes]|uniref:NAC domain-containing protein n=1 Tax=Dichanthelium oligosanthes TaxID=888268 RepID=A0A1E5VB50_9POAL|nr:hypothetical protein BAE44_0016602 [Dichanthelium oligosanthes]
MRRPLAAETPQPGDPASSTPADDELLGFLRQKLKGEALPAAAGAHFHDADIYAADPATLTLAYQPAPARKGEQGGPGSSWFFFTCVRPKSSSDSRKSRTVGGGAGTWHSERAPRRVLDGEGSCVGHSQYFSFKRRTGKGCSERTDWYMVEFSEAQEGDHERVRGGEPALVLCNIYKKHSSSRSSSSSRSARKRKATEEHVDQSSAPLKAKRRLFEPPAPTPAAASQEQVSSILSIVTSGLYSRGEAAKSLPESSHGLIGCTFDHDQVSHGEIGGTLDHHPIFCSELEASQGMINSTSNYLKFSPETLQHKMSTTPPSLLISEPDASQSKIGGTLDDHLRFWAEAEASQSMIDSPSAYLNPSPEPETWKNKTSTAPPCLLMSEPQAAQNKAALPSLLMSEPETAQNKATLPSLMMSESKTAQNKATLPSLMMSEPETVQGKIGGTSDYLRFWPEPEASQGMINGTSDYLKTSSETEELQNKTSTTTPPSLSTFKPEVPASQGKMATFNSGIQVAGGDTSPAPAHCYGTTNLLMIDGYSSGIPLWGRPWSYASWTANDNVTTLSSCRNLGCTVGAQPTSNLWSTAGFASSPNLCSMPSTTLLPPPLSPSPWYGGPVLWSF